MKWLWLCYHSSKHLCLWSCCHRRGNSFYFQINFQKSSFYFQRNLEAISTRFELLGFLQSSAFSRSELLSSASLCGSSCILRSLQNFKDCWKVLQWHEISAAKFRLGLFAGFWQDSQIAVNLYFWTGTMWDSLTVWDFQIFEIWLAFSSVYGSMQAYEVHRYEAVKALA